MSSARSRIISWWEVAYFDDAEFGPRFSREAEAALPVVDGLDGAAVYDALDWRRLRLS